MIFFVNLTHGSEGVRLEKIYPRNPKYFGATSWYHYEYPTQVKVDTCKDFIECFEYSISNVGIDEVEKAFEGALL